MEDELARCKARPLSDAPLDWSQFRVLRPPPFFGYVLQYNIRDRIFNIYNMHRRTDRMKPEENVYVKKSNLGAEAKTYESITGIYDPVKSFNDGLLAAGKDGIGPHGKLTMVDPITQICKRIEAFFRGCPGIMVRYCVNNSQMLDWKKDEHGDYIVGSMTYEETGMEVPVFYSEDHINELRLYVTDVAQAMALANVIRHRHVENEEFAMLSPIDGSDAIGKRAHILIVRVMMLDNIDPSDKSQAGDNPYSSEDDNYDAVIKEAYGVCPLRWNDMDGYGVAYRLAPNAEEDPEYPDTPKDVPDEYEQYLWETGFTGTDPDGQPVVVSNVQACNWKMKWLREALRDNPNIVDMSYEFNDGLNQWRFIECSRLPVVFGEDNLSSARGFNSILAADLLPVIFPLFGSFQISTYARKSMIK